MVCHSHQLQASHVLLPPKILLHVGSQSGQAIVSVHDGVDEWIDHTYKETCGKQAKINIKSTVSMATEDEEGTIHRFSNLVLISETQIIRNSVWKMLKVLEQFQRRANESHSSYVSDLIHYQL